MDANSETVTKSPCGDWLVVVIEEAFRDVAYPGDDQLWVRIEADPLIGMYWDDLLLGTDWREVGKYWETPDECRGVYGDMWCFLTVEALVYYTPAVLTLAAREIGWHFAMNFIEMLGGIEHSEFEESVAMFQRFVGALSSAQCRAIAMTVRCLQGDLKGDKDWFEGTSNAWMARADAAESRSIVIP